MIEQLTITRGSNLVFLEENFGLEALEQWLEENISASDAIWEDVDYYTDQRRLYAGRVFFEYATVGEDVSTWRKRNSA